MITVSIHSTLADAAIKLDGLAGRQLPFTLAKALTNTAQDAKAALRADMERSFDRPTAYTLNSLFVTPARKSDLTAVVALKDMASKGRPASRYLMPEIKGGPRSIKGMELKLTGKGLLPAGMTVVPARGAPLDSFGNFKRGEFTKILTSLDGTRPQAKRKRRRVGSLMQYFIPSRTDKHLHPGVYGRYKTGNGTTVRPILLFVRIPTYRQRFDFYGVVERTVAQRFEKHLRDAAAYAMESSR